MHPEQGNDRRHFAIDGGVNLALSLKKIPIPYDVELIYLFGQKDVKLRSFRERFQVDISAVDDEIWVRGEDSGQVECAVRMLSEFVRMVQLGHVPDDMETEYLLDRYTQIGKESGQSNDSIPKDVGFQSPVLGAQSALLKMAKVKPKTKGQAKYLEAMKEYDIVFSIGPAGTGKTYLAVAMAVEALKSGKAQRIILTRPAVEAGERLGFLPGSLVEKVDPYLRPLYDALFDMITPERFQFLKEKQIIEIAPLAYMRGRTLNHSFIILDEAQNTTHQQMKMFLTRIGFYSKAVITGDITQVDLQKGVASGLVECQSILEGVSGISFVSLGKQDVIRHPLVKSIIDAYERFEETQPNAESTDG